MIYAQNTRAAFVLALGATLVAPAIARAADAAPRIAGESLMEHVRILAADSLEGRRTGERGCERAADYIAAAFAGAGLTPAGDDGGWLQWYEAIVGESLGVENAFVLERTAISATPLTPPPGAGAPATPPEPVRSVALNTLAVGEEWIPFGFSESGSLASAPIVFAGYGITAPEKNYDDYAMIDARGKVVLVLRYEPGNRDSTSAFDGTRLTSFADFRWKAWNAQNHGAVAVIFANGPLDVAEPKDDTLFPLARDAGHASGGSATIPIVQIQSQWAERLVAWDGLNLRELQAAIDSTGAPLSAPLDAGRVASLSVDIVKDRRRVANVVGKFAGAGTDARAEEAIVIGAHYDHLGLGGEGSLEPDSAAVHNGADDNASGTAALIEIARAFVTDPPPSRRALIFAAWSGEEEGLLGSAFYTKSPAVPLAQTRAKINMDMIGRSKDGKLHVGGVGTSPEFRSIVASESEPLGFATDYSDGGFGPSDHTSFYAKGIPVLFFFTGAHEDYHKSTDDTEKIEVEGLGGVATLVERVARRLATDPDEIAFVRVAADTVGRGASEGYATTKGYGPYLGTIPDFGEYEGAGVLLSGVRPGSPAEKAGIQGGDVVVRFGGIPIANLYDYTYALRDKKVGDVVEIQVERAGEILTVAATLEKRK
ncbi:MAG: M28 family peptidase [bacterium]